MRKQKRIYTLPLDLNTLVKSEMLDSEVTLESGDTVLMINLIQIQEQEEESILSTELNKATVEELIEQLSPVAKSIATNIRMCFLKNFHESSFPRGMLI